jgi:hypothetical protein
MFYEFKLGNASTWVREKGAETRVLHAARRGVVTCDCVSVDGVAWQLEMQAKSKDWHTEVWCDGERFARGRLATRQGLLGSVTAWEIETGREPVWVHSTFSVPPWTLRFRHEGALVAMARMGCMRLKMVYRRKFSAWGPFFALVVLREAIGGRAT